MLTFKYTARDSATGQKVSSEIQATSEAAVAKLLHDQGLSPIDIKSQDAGQGGGIVAKYKNRINSKDKILFSRQLSTLINAGLPLVQSLRTVADQTQNKAFKGVVYKVITDVESGQALSVSLQRHPLVFNRVYTSMIAAGETSGTLDKSLERLASQQEKDAELMSKVKGAMVYPLVVMVVMGAVMAFMLIKVVPQVEQLYEGLGSGAELPLVTRALIFVSNLITRFWYLIAALVGLAIFFGSRWARTAGGKYAVDRFKMKAPVIGPLFMKMYMARFARTGTTLVSSGVPLIQMLEITSDAIDNVHIESSLHRAMEKVKAGKALSDSIENDPNFLSLVPDMLRIGEQSGAIEQMMDKIADYYEKEVDNQIKTLSTVIEPALMIILGVMAFIIVAAVLLPVYSLAGKGINF